MRYTEVPRLVGCARCGGNHRHLRFVKLRRKAGHFTHWVLCPRTQEPILMRIVTEVPSQFHVSCRLAVGP